MNHFILGEYKSLFGIPKEQETDLSIFSFFNTYIRSSLAMMLMRLVPLVTLLSVSFVARRIAAVATCYHPDGTPQQWHKPCNESAKVSHCCVESDACISNGYCFQQSDYPQDWGNRITRASCTDPTFGSHSCPQYCKDGKATNTRKLQLGCRLTSYDSRAREVNYPLANSE